MKITKELVREAYKKIKLKPIPGCMTTMEDKKVIGCCVLAAIYIANAEDGLKNVNKLGFASSWLEKHMTRSEMNGLAEGFDGHTDSGFDKQMYQLGKELRKELV